MSAYLVASVSVKNPEKWSTYTDGAKALIEAAGGSVMVFDKQPTVLVGKFTHSAQVILEFPDKDTLMTWFTSEDYQKLVPTRDEGADVLFVAVN
jgi:uncharacterized protein (DUF1330 family)